MRILSSPKHSHLTKKYLRSWMTEVEAQQKDILNAVEHLQVRIVKKFKQKYNSVLSAIDWRVDLQSRAGSGSLSDDINNGKTYFLQFVTNILSQLKVFFHFYRDLV